MNAQSLVAKVWNFAHVLCDIAPYSAICRSLQRH
jgi:hypothetical protein